MNFSTGPLIIKIIDDYSLFISRVSQLFLILVSLVSFIPNFESPDSLNLGTLKVTWIKSAFIPLH